MIGIIILTVLGLLLSLILVNLKEALKDKDEEILKLLPGYNCGACGFVGCKQMAEVILKDKENYKKCRLLKNESLEKMKNYIDKMK